MSNNTNPCKADVSEANTGIDTRRQIESMTLGEIKEAKSRLVDRIGEAIEREIEAFSKVYNWGIIRVDVETDVEYCYAEGMYKDKRHALVSRITRKVIVKSELEEDE